MLDTSSHWPRCREAAGSGWPGRPPSSVRIAAAGWLTLANKIAQRPAA